MKTQPSTPLLVVLSAPSGAGKTTLCRRLFETWPELAYSISCTTRAPRGEERDGVNYHFLDEADFQRRVDADEFLEHARVHGARYGTLRSTVEGHLAEGRDLVMDIDVQGASQIRATIAALPETHPLRRGFLDIFILPPSFHVLRARLEGRGEDEKRVIEQRLVTAREEMARWNEYRYLVVNDQIDRAAADLESILRAEHLLVRAD